MQKRNGGKRRGGHSTLIDLADEVIGLIEKLSEVTGFSPGHIRVGQSVAGGARKVKIGEATGSLLLTVRQSMSVQEIRVYGPNLQAAKLEIARKLRNNQIPISFRHE